MSIVTGRSYQETIDYLYGLQKHGVKLGLANSLALMELTGNPHLRFRTVHVAGTNGKGSTSAFLAGMLKAAGLRVGLYTSPHLVSFTERIRINGTPIPEEKVVEYGRLIRERWHEHAGRGGSEPQAPTFFEVTTAVAFAWFAEQAVDIAVVEVGMGGRLDSTNVITPLVSVITNIEMEHTEFLGDTLELIAAEKAGIIKPGVPVVAGAVRPEALGVIEAGSRSAGARLSVLGRDFNAEDVRSGREQRFHYRGMNMSLEGLAIALQGRHQVDNACLALAALEQLHQAGIACGPAAARSGLALTRWEGRLEPAGRSPDIYLDGAHNPAAAKVLASALAGMRSGYARVVLVIGILGDKDFRGILSELVPLADLVIVTKPDYSRAMDLDVLAREVRSLHSSVQTAESVELALQKARAAAGPDDLVLVTGSLYVVGDARFLLLEGPPPALSNLKG